MSEPWYEDDNVTLWAGDCLDVLREMPDASVDAVVTDPPYGLEFMGKEWDSFRQVDPRTAGRSRDVTGASGTSRDNQTDRSTPGGRTGVAFGGTRPKTWWCPDCGKRDQFRKHSAKAPDCQGVWEQVTLYADQAPPAILAFGEWCRMWAAECLRVLKPGGFIAAFGGTRTFHRLACAVEDAGFEIRDSIGYGSKGGDATEVRPSLLAWVYGSGFP